MCELRNSDLFVQSLRTAEGIVPTEEALAWIAGLNAAVDVDIKKTTLAATKWFYDEQSGQIVNEKRTFFQICGLRNGEEEQPIIIQDEIGYLGILCKPFGGVLHFLIQAKIEPGNINKIQLSPTIQATKSNFTRAHGGNAPAYLDWFLNADKHEIIVDQIQSEQSSRFLGKRNRNIIVMADEDAEIEQSRSHKWLTLGQIKQLMRTDNLVNMDTRTVLSCIPYYQYDFSGLDGPLPRSLTNGQQPDVLSKVYHYVNNYKMNAEGKSQVVPLYSLQHWAMFKSGSAEEFSSKTDGAFKIVFCDISIDGREVRRWGQPLFEARGMALFGLFTRVNNGTAEFLVRAKPEVGCFDKIELGPTVQMETTAKPENNIDELFLKCYNEKRNIRYDVVLSEEGGRFYHEQNKNIIIEIDPADLSVPPQGYWWCTYRTLNKLGQINNILNIQLRNLLSLLIF